MKRGLLKQAKEDFQQLTKQDIGDILNLDEITLRKTKKPELLELLFSTYANTEWNIEGIYSKYAITFSIHPSKVEEDLHITKTERLRWTEEEKLPVAGYASFSKWGKTISYPLYDCYKIRAIKPKQIEKWRENHQKNVTKNRKTATKKAVAKRKENETKHKLFYEQEWKNMLKEWHSVDGFLASTMQLSYWTMWVSRWAKEFQVKSKRAITKQDEYLEKVEMFYEMKNQAMEWLTHSPYTTISFYEPDYPDKMTHLSFCDNHYEQWCLAREFDYVSKWDFYGWNEKQINKCKNCEIEIVEDYYSLYYVAVRHEKLENYYFSFHTPHPIGKKFLPDKKELPQIQHQEQEGLFRFGRTLFEEEKVIFREKEVIKMWNEAVAKYQLYVKQVSETI